MNTYKITFSRENGTTGTDHFTAATEAQARRDFREVYRHGKGDIIDIELVSTDAPAAKQQERDALEKIRKIVEQLGPDSYVGTAFQGCFEIAAENIENDFACSMADKVHRAEADVVRLREANTLAATRVNELENKLAEAEKDYEAAHAAAHEVAAQKDAEIEALKAKIKQIQETARWNGQRCDEEATAAGEAQRRAEAAEAEVIRLKAKLYDFMVGGAQE